MSANLDLVRSIYAGIGSGDFGSAEWADPQIEFVMAEGPDAGSWTGKADMAKAAREHLSAWEGFRVEPEEYRELDDERVLVLVHRTARGKTSGLQLGQVGSKGAQLFHVRDGKVTRYVTWINRDRALADLGLATQALHTQLAAAGIEHSGDRPRLVNVQPNKGHTLRHGRHLP